MSITRMISRGGWLPVNELVVISLAWNSVHFLAHRLKVIQASWLIISNYDEVRDAFRESGVSSFMGEE